MLYAAKCYWPGISAAELESAGSRAAEASFSKRQAGSIAYLGSILFPDDELALCLFDAPSQAAARRASEKAGIPCERVMQTVWLAPPSPEPKETF